MLSRFFDENLAAQGYLDISYIALIVWAVVLEVEKPRRGWPVFLLLAAAGLLRPDAWVISGVYWLWCAWPKRARLHAAGVPGFGGDRAGRVGAADPIVTHNPFYSLHSTAGLAQELGRTQGFSASSHRSGRTRCGSTSCRSCLAG